MLDAFAAETGIRVLPVFDTEASKTTGLYQRLLAEKDRPRADVFWNSEAARTVALAAAGVLEPYASPGAAGIPAPYRAGDGTWTGFGARARVLIYHRGRVGEAERPRGIADLAAARFRGAAAIALPLFGTTATHAGALRARLGRERMEEFFRSLAANDVRVVDGNSVVRDRVAAGELAVGLTDTDDAHVALLKGLPVGVVFPDQEPCFPGLETALGTFVIPNTASLVRGGPRPDLGKRLVDYLLRPETEEVLARGESAQIPLRPGLKGPERLAPPAALVTMEVSFEEAARGLEEETPFLRDLFVK